MASPDEASRCFIKRCFFDAEERTLSLLKLHAKNTYGLHYWTHRNDGTFGRVHNHGGHGHTRPSSIVGSEPSADRDPNSGSHSTDARHDSEPVMIADCPDDRIPTDEKLVHERSGYDQDDHPAGNAPIWARDPDWRSKPTIARGAH
jgi:hypothetical protein